MVLLAKALLDMILTKYISKDVGDWLFAKFLIDVYSPITRTEYMKQYCCSLGKSVTRAQSNDESH